MSGLINGRDSVLISTAKAPNLTLGPPSFHFSVYRRVFLSGLNQPGRATDHTPHLVPKIKNEWSLNFTPSHAFMA